MCINLPFPKIIIQSVVIWISNKEVKIIDSQPLENSRKSFMFTL